MTGQTRGTDQTGEITSLSDLDVIADADAHVTENPEDIFPYIDGKYSGIKKIIEAATHPHNDVFSRSRATPSHPFRKGMIQGNGYGGTTNNLQEKAEQMDEFGISSAIITPSLMAGLTTVNNTRYAVALANAYNSWMIDHFQDAGDRFGTALVVPPQAPEKGAEEIDRLGDEDVVVAVVLPATGLLPPPGHRWYDPIYEAAQDHDLSVLFHGSATATMYAFPTQQRWHETAAEGHAMCHPFTSMWNLMTMVFRGIPERFPDLNFVFQESGIGWIPYWTWRLDDHYYERSYDLPILEKPPSEYIKESFYFTTQPLGHTQGNASHIAKAIELAGPESILWASDLPHPDFDTPDELFDRIVTHLDDDTVRGIMGETAQDLFGL